MDDEEELSSWRELLAKARKKAGDDSALLKITLSEKQLDRKFPIDYGGGYEIKWMGWTEKRVYFPNSYDGWLSVCSVPRNPCNETIMTGGDHVL